MTRKEWDLLQILMARPGQRVPLADLTPAVGGRYPLQRAISGLRRTLADARLEIRTDGRTRRACTWYGLFDLDAEARA